MGYSRRKPNGVGGGVEDMGFKGVSKKQQKEFTRVTKKSNVEFPGVLVVWPWNFQVI